MPHIQAPRRQILVTMGARNAGRCWRWHVEAGCPVGGIAAGGGYDRRPALAPRSPAQVRFWCLRSAYQPTTLIDPRVEAVEKGNDMIRFLPLVLASRASWVRRSVEGCSLERVPATELSPKPLLTRTTLIPDCMKAKSFNMVEGPVAQN